MFGPQAEAYLGPELLSGPVFYPCFTTLVKSGKTIAVVDPGDLIRLLSSGGSNARSAGPAPSPLLEQLRSAGVGPSDVTHVVITHLHFDHYAGVTRSDGTLLPSFPKAEYIIPSKDWVMTDIREGREKGDKAIAETLGVIADSGRMSLNEGRRELAGGVAIEPAPGESPGHQLVAVGPPSHRGYVIGDLYHQREEIEHPELMAVWVDRGTLAASRKSFSERAHRESAVVFPGHTPPGRIAMSGGKATWVEVVSRG